MTSHLRDVDGNRLDDDRRDHRCGFHTDSDYGYGADQIEEARRWLQEQDGTFERNLEAARAEAESQFPIPDKAKGAKAA